MRLLARVRLAGGLRLRRRLRRRRRGAGGASTVMCSRCPIDRRARVEGDTRTPSLRIYRPIDQGQERIAADASLRSSRSPLALRAARPSSSSRKDLRIELATREIVTTAGFFAALVAIMASLSFADGAGDDDPGRARRALARHRLLLRPGARADLAARAGGVGAPRPARLARPARGHLVRQGGRRARLRPRRRARRRAARRAPLPRRPPAASPGRSPSSCSSGPSASPPRGPSSAP